MTGSRHEKNVFLSLPVDVGRELLPRALLNCKTYAAQLTSDKISIIDKSELQANLRGSVVFSVTSHVHRSRYCSSFEWIYGFEWGTP